MLSATLESIADGIVVVRTDDGRVFGLDATDGSRKWVYDRSAVPALSLRGNAVPRIADGVVYAGEDNGKLVALRLKDGFALEQFIAVAPSLVEGSGKLDAEQCTAALAEVWTKPEEAKANFALAYRATEAFASKIGVTFDEIEAAGLGDNPLFIRIMAAIGPELGEDTSPSTAGTGGGISVEEFENQAAALRQQLQELPMSDKRRPAVKAQYDALYAKRFGTAKQKLSGGVVVST